MVNYCCVYGCGRNSRTSNNLYYYCLPKDKKRLHQWLSIIGRKDLLESNRKILFNRVCSRHFSPSNIKNKRLCVDAIPSLCLPTADLSEDSIDSEQNQISSDIICNSCEKLVIGTRYKCITCLDYDLCSKCEMLEVHSHHYILRIPKSENYAIADSLVKEWQKIFTSENVKIDTDRKFKEDSSDDDIPINKFVKNYESIIDLSDEVKCKIYNEVDRVLSIKQTDLRVYKNKSPKKKKTQQVIDISNGNEDMRGMEIDSAQELENTTPELVFADVNAVKGTQSMEIKEEIANTLAPLVPVVQESEQEIMDMKLNELSEFLIGVKYP